MTNRLIFKLKNIGAYQKYFSFQPTIYHLFIFLWLRNVLHMMRFLMIYAVTNVSVLEWWWWAYFTHHSIFLKYHHI